MTDLSLYSANEIVEWFKYLDKNGGSTDGAELVNEFGLSKEKAEAVSLLWIKSYDRKIPVDRRARAVYAANGGTL